MTEKLTTYDPAADLASDEAIAIFMAEAFQTSDAGYVAHALGIVARAKGMAQIAGQTGLSREQLYRSFSENGNPTLKTTLRMRTTNGLERLNKELKRRTRVATLFPNPDSCLRLISALLAEQDEEWMTAKIYLTMKP